MAGLALAPAFSPSGLRAQHEADRSARRDEPAKLDGNENPYGPSQLAVMAMMQTIERTPRYGFAEVEKLIALVAAREGVPAEQIVMGVGSGDVLERYAAWLSRESGEVVTATPGYLRFTQAMARHGSTVVAVPLAANLRHDLAAMAAKVGPATRCVYLCNPHNPTSTLVPAEALRAFAVEVAKRCPVFVDEAYLECSDDFAANTMVGLVREGHNVVVARTFSKIYGLAGMRIGYAVTPPVVAREMNAAGRGNTAFRLNLLGAVAAAASLEDSGYVEDTRLKIKAERDKLCALLKDLGRRYAEPQGNFVFFHTGMPAPVFLEKMAAERVAVGRAFPPLLDWCRLSIGTPEEMALAHAALRKVFAA